MTKIAVFLLKLYRLFLSPYIPTTCRFYPTCSCYMSEAIQKKGFWRGVSLGLLRILKCNPFHPGGFDPVR
jgi:putative membrane protein insertion efficiency factor